MNNRINKSILFLSIANPDFVTKYRRKDLINQDLNGYFHRVHYVFLFDEPLKPTIQHINSVFTVISLSNKRFAWLQKIGLQHLNTLLSLILNIIYLWRYACKNDISIYFAQEPFIRGSLAFVISKITRKPYVVEICANFRKRSWDDGVGVLPMFRSINFEKRLLRFILRRANAVIADRDNYWNDNIIPHEIGNKYFRYHFSMEEAHYIPPEKRINLKERYHAANKKVILYIGRLITDKKSEDLSLVAESLFLNNELQDTIMWIVGDGPLKQYLMEEITKHGLSDKVIFIDNQPTSMVAHFLSTADVVIAPHAGWVIPECQLAETPIIVYDFEWNKEGTGDGKFGIVVPYRDSKAMADAAKDVLLFPDKYTSMIKQARQWVLQNNTLEREIEDKLKIYSKVFGEDKWL